MSSGTWTTTKGGGLGITISTGGVVALIAAGYALTHPKQATAAVNGAATIAAITVVIVVALGLAAFVTLKLRGRSRGTAPDGGRQSLLIDRRDALPPRERPAIAPVVINNFTVDPAKIADLFATARQQPAYVPSVQSEPRQEIRP